ncbi:class III lanthionine synthetase LanKC [Streptomyces gobiensis]|uniref:class III lanthionine synthetase LanKC n=1 Tax=Streptomyces gobiensis TaxID=2875706 RepID=UPI001E3E9F80|nr:class III lanthionine synthetase LanKC [Streptomyces gobiensis]UGY91135.1 class III lanthionine synthetase LanKC [Streptomyces gobiensis]
MDSRYEVFCLADRNFYETPGRMSARPGGADTVLSTAQRPVPDGWRHTRSADWLELRPTGGQFPAQGWKIHVSAGLHNADRVAARVWDYCVARTIPFKFVPDLNLLRLRNAKYASRGTSGKFCTIYPTDDDQLHTILTELGDLLDGEPGPYILTDLRWREGPLYVRYGGFAARYCLDEQGQLVPAMEDGEGRTVPDRRDPAFSVPEWVTLPGFLQPHLNARNAATVADLPYRIERALHFSNGGGVYAGKDLRTGEDVVLKEGRPYAGLAADSADAVTRLEREKAALERLAGLSVAPAVRDWFSLDGHHFLVMDFLPGQTLNSFFAQRHPLLVADPDPDAVAEYTQWALAIHRAVAEAVAAVHERGLVFNDLHMFNIMVAPDEKSVALLDFEAAALAEDNPRQIVAHPGFIAPADRRRFEIDHYALACLRLALFIPMTTLLAIDRSKASHLAHIAAAQFPDIPEDFLTEAVTEIEHSPSVVGSRPAQALWALAAPRGAVGGHNTRPPSRTGHPGAPGRSPSFREGAGIGETNRRGTPQPGGAPPRGGAADRHSREGAGIGETQPRVPVGGEAPPRGGAAGRPSREGARPGEPHNGPHPEHGPHPITPWPQSRDSMAQAILASATPTRDDRLFPGDIAQFAEGGGLGLAHGAAGVLYALAETGAPRYEQGEQWLLDHTDPAPRRTPFGLYDGLLGVAHVLDGLGHRTRALELTDRVLAEKWQQLGPDLHSGLAGLGLALDRLGTTTGQGSLHTRAMEAAELAAAALAEKRLAEKRDGSRTGSARAGLLYGATGPALLFLRLHERTGDPALLDLAGDALRQDLARCVRDSQGSLQVDEGPRMMPYLGAGSAGIAMVLDDYLAYRPDAAEFQQARDGILPAAKLRYYAQPGLFRGRAGMILHLGRTATPGATADDLEHQLDCLSWSAMSYQGHLAFPGDQMMRLSMDLSTGTAGCLLAVGSALHHEPVQLPFLPPLKRP